MSEPARKSIFIGTFIFCRDLNTLERLKDTAICVNDQGVIVAIERKFKQEVQFTQILLSRLGWIDSEVVICRSEEGQFFFPGFIDVMKGDIVDTHIHAPQFSNSGIFGQTTLLDWLNKYTFPTEGSMEDLSKARQVYTRCIQRTLSHGTTTAVYFATRHVDASNLLADICLAKGQRAFIGRCCMDSELNPVYYRDLSPEECINDTRASIQHIGAIDPQNKLITPIITPRFALSCTSHAMHALGLLQKETGIPVQTHISETKAEVNLVRELFPQCANYADVYDQHGLLGEKTILAHAVHLTEEECDLIKIRRSKISHCPISNSALASGQARVRWLLEKGIDVGLGSDVSGGYSTSILETARHALLVSRHVAMHANDEAKLSAEEVLYLATRGGAKLVGMEKELGAFEVGMIWDAQLIGLSRCRDETSPTEDDGLVDIFSWEEDGNQIYKWLFNGDDRNSLAVWVQGNLVHQRNFRGNLTSIGSKLPVHL
ncbi:putative guanine deaminase [Golovinomyces cichoracearum]|uniref:Probable guanine deaminase n=1 Tax=Golovinomyces cichoracearum TaxID=62708 RepID=A0A420I751_9PEZI|nr:putative guanine deaminase [Golovinomyces cichoracearum]